MEEILKQIIESPLVIEILYDAIHTIQYEAGLSDYETKEILINSYNDWDK